MSYPAISCVFPVLNEAAILRRQIEIFIKELVAKKISRWEIILVENGSRDSSWRIIETLSQADRRIRGIRLTVASYGRAIKAGMEAARGRVVFIFNVDFFDSEFVVQSLPLLKVADIVIGSKTLAASRDERSIWRRNLTYLFNAMLRLTLNYPGTDTHGIKAIKMTPLLLYTLDRCRTKNELFDTEMIIRMARWGAKLIELPIGVKEIRPTRYLWSKRIVNTAVDFFTAAVSKFLIPNFDKRLVVADDYGLNSEVNKEIIRYAKKGIMHQVSIMANRVTQADVNKLAKINHNLKYSVHLNVVEGKPVSPKEQISSLINGGGNFYATSLFLPRLFLGLIKSNEVELEYNNQTNRLVDMGVKLTHMDSHQHSHLFPPLWNLTLKLADKWQIEQIRSYDSARYSLVHRGFKYLVFVGAMWLLKLRYGKNRLSTKAVNEIIIHPGTSLY